MPQNTSSAVMAQRIEPKDSLDDFPTPPWGVRALCEHVLIPAHASLGSCWEPTSNRGYMVRPLHAYFDTVYASDVRDYSAEYPHGMLYFDKNGAPHEDDGKQSVRDFLFPGSEPPHIASNGVDWCCFNPPFRLAGQFIIRAMDVARIGVAALVRTSFLEGCERYESIFRDMPPAIVAQFVERLPIVRGRIDRRASTATSYCWLVWLRDVPGNTAGPRMCWIPPCRKALERDEDYPAVVAP